jgi:hypothetical protein
MELPLRMVNQVQCLPLNCSNEILADVEAEDVELGNNEDDLAFDIDDGVADEDPEALDSDGEQSSENGELGIDMDETESKQICDIRCHVSRSISSCSSNAYRASVLSIAQ